MFGKIKYVLEKSFALKIFLSFSVAAFVILAVFTTIVLVREMRYAGDALMKQGRMLAGLLAYSSKTAVFAENRAELDELAKGTMLQQNVLAISIFSADENTLLGEWEKNGSRRHRSSGISSEAVAALRDGSEFWMDEKDGFFDCYSPVIIETAGSADSLYFDGPSVHIGKNVIGYVRVTMDKSLLHEELQSILLRSGMTFILIFLAAGIFVFIGLKRLTQPLTVLTEQVRRLGLGESVEKVPVGSPDELGRLSITFNEMNDDLQKRQEEKDRLEEQLRNAQKMEAVGTLARGIAHDFNNILTTVQGSVYMLDRKLGADPAIKHYIVKIMNSLDKARNLTQELITFSKIQAISFHPVDLKQIIMNLLPVVEVVKGDAVALKVSLPESSIMVTGDPVQIEQILLNLCVNARDAMPDGGELEINARILNISDEGHPDYQLPPPGEYAVMTLTDTGTGIDEETRQRMFDPFFTTKDVGKGTGLGLSIVYWIVQQHKGHIRVNSRKGEGAAFSIFLPVMSQDVPEAASALSPGNKEKTEL